jgi:hypothetical protein
VGSTFVALVGFEGGSGGRGDRGDGEFMVISSGGSTFDGVVGDGGRGIGAMKTCLGSSSPSLW